MRPREGGGGQRKDKDGRISGSCEVINNNPRYKSQSRAASPIGTPLGTSQSLQTGFLKLFNLAPECGDLPMLTTNQNSGQLILQCRSRGITQTDNSIPLCGSCEVITNNPPYESQSRAPSPVGTSKEQANPCKLGS